MTGFATHSAYDSAGTATPLVAPLSRDASRVGDFIALLKPRVMSLVVFTGAVGLMMAPHVALNRVHPILALIAVLCIAVSAGGAGAINMWYDRDIDAMMRRTAARPIPMGHIDPAEALAFGIILSGAAVVVMGLALNWIAAGLLAAATFFYVFVYTIWLKRWTPQNIVIGGAAGAFPPMIGYAAVTGTIDLASLTLFALIFFWTPAHFWALSLYASDDYRRAKIPMLPIVAGIAATKRQIILYTGIVSIVALSPYAVGLAHGLYAGVAGILSGVFLVQAFRVYRAAEGDHGPARRMFRYSLLYLFLLFAALLIDRALSLGL
ncbi:MAG: heme o synthase [Alphaproteobacteria bacterium]